MSKSATAEGTRRYKEKFKATIPQEHFKMFRDLCVSSVGLGTYLGDADERTDSGYIESISAALSAGCNLIDTAINYRFQRSERNIGTALERAFKEQRVERDEVLIATKGGFLSFDGSVSNPANYFEEEFVQKGICDASDMVAGCHCMTPAYLENQVDRSLRNLRIDCIDIYFIHNPETQLSEISRQDFLKRMLAAFKLLERIVAAGKIRSYGTATWNGYREREGSRSYLSLEELVGLARIAGGDDHHFRAIQLPYNLAMPEAALSKNQKLGTKNVTLLEAAQGYGMIVLASASILQGQLSRGLPQELRSLFSLRSDAQRSLQFVRSTPGVTCALVGMSSPEHVYENLQVAAVPPLDWDQMSHLFS